MLAKEGFSERYDKENPIFLHEFLYPLMQGYDSIAVEADVELGGTDQKFNIAVGRDLQKYFGKKPQFGLLLPILIGTDGSQKMSKSLNNYVGLRESALSMYSKLEKTPDALLKDYYELLTNLPLDAMPSNPREAQKQLAIEVVAQFHGEEEALKAQKTAQEIVLQGNTAAAASVPEFSLASVTFPLKLFYLLSATGLCKSSGEGRRQIQGGAVRIDSEKITDVDKSFETAEALTGKVLQVGKNKFIRFVA
jgi:tyrosyl-tRNA synthetase